jgi:hypothetical protein
MILGLVGAWVLLAGYGLVSAAASGDLSSHSLASAAKTISPASTPTLAHTTPGPRPSAPANTPASHSLTAASVVAFGPEGTVDGDNPGIVSRVNGGETQPWYSSWYATPEFGNLKSGTGLLLDMGTAVNVSSVRLSLGSQPGADVQVRVGNSATLGGLTAVASAAGVGSDVRLSVTPPSSGRYVLVWFTRLPPDLQGQYQIDVYGVTVDGAGR